MLQENLTYFILKEEQTLPEKGGIINYTEKKINKWKHLCVCGAYKLKTAMLLLNQNEYLNYDLLAFLLFQILNYFATNITRMDVQHFEMKLFS